MSHAELHSLLGPYALNAVSVSEAQQVEEHLRSCEDCAREVAVLSEVAGELSALVTPMELSPDFADRVVDSLPPRLSDQRRVIRAVAAVAAIAAVAVGIVGGAYLQERSRSTQFAQIAKVATSTIDLQPNQGFPGSGRVFVTESELAVAMTDVPDVGPELVYQLWSLSDNDVAHSITTFTPTDGRITAVIKWEGSRERFAVTVEQAPGSRTPKSVPILYGA